MQGNTNGSTKMTNDFTYLIDKIRITDFSTEPFKHIYIEDFFSSDHFDEIVTTNEISLAAAKSDRGLFDALFDKGYKIIPFPGCITDQKKYADWRAGKKKVEHHSACEGFGVAFRLFTPTSSILRELDEFLNGEAFNRCLAEKFSVPYEDCRVDVGIQKYLDGYEISPHPDIRRKATTFMVNINPRVASERANHHTHYLRFKPERRYVQTFWEGNPSIDRCWVPWDWTETVYQQTKNNSIVLFSPSNDTMHGVKADYNHLLTQRTQLYGNLWFKEFETEGQLEWEDFDFRGNLSRTKRRPIKKAAQDVLSNKIMHGIRKFLSKQNNDIGRRTY
jgi:hypothetical protein